VSLTANQPSLDSGATYNERLFGTSRLRSFYHLARFEWAERKVRALAQSRLSVIELGCFDGRLFEQLRDYVSDYVGLDANWEGGLDLARKKFRDSPRVSFVEVTQPSQMHDYEDARFDVSVSLETLEHLPPELVPGFLDELRRVTRGHFLASFPNELGPVFLAKHLLKRIRYGDAEAYTGREIIAATLGRSKQVSRREHKGFDYRDMIDQIAARFEIVSVEGLPGVGLPPSLSPTVAVHARVRSHA
jgi:2-polyprenyl-3-methyl-5-hydroxy-6-metoxy-1,4-benzoquinol methylase